MRLVALSLLLLLPAWLPADTTELPVEIPGPAVSFNPRGAPILDPGPGASRRAPTEPPAVSDPDPGSPLPPLHPDGRFFRDPQGRAVFLRGVNYSHRTKSRPYISWQSPDHMAQLERWGFNCVRYLVMWDALEPEPGVYDPVYLAHIERVLAWAQAHGIYVLLDMHQDLYSRVFGGDGAPPWAAVDNLVEPNEWKSPWFLTYFTTEVLASFRRLWTDTELQDRYAAAWAQVAARARGHTNVLGYDLINEPFPGRSVPWYFEKRRLTPFYRRIGAAIRAQDPDAALFLEPAAITANVGLPTSLEPAPGAVAYAPHYYDLLLELGHGYGNRGWIARRAARVQAGEAARWKAPLFLGEFGVGRGNEGALAAMEDQAAAYEAVLASGWTLWNYTPEIGADGPLPADGMSLTARGEPHPALPAFLRPYPRAVAGTPRTMSFAHTSRRFVLEVTSPSPSLDTVVFLPVEHFADFTVDTNGAWSFDAARRELHVRAPSGSPLLRVTVQGK